MKGIELTIDIKITKDDTCSGLTTPNFLKFSKEDIFNYGVFHYEIPPEKLSDNNFEYLESKIPAYILMYEDHVDISIKNNSIKSKVGGEAAKNLSEIVGIATGLKSAIKIFNLNKKDIENIPVSGTVEKRLDYKSSYKGSEIQIETKGTTYKSSIGGMIKHVHEKKVGKGNVAHKYGFVTLFDPYFNDKNGTQIFITDPEVEGTPPRFEGIRRYINYYMNYFSFILDNAQYNKLSSFLFSKRKLPKYREIINTRKIKYSFDFNNKKYLGQCFDKRLILNFIESNCVDGDNKNTLFDKLTKKNDKNKYFLGIEERVIHNINKGNENFFEDYKNKVIYESKEKYVYIQMEDGILLIISRNGALDEMERKFSENDVKKRLGYMYDFYKGSAHRCGAPCTSDELNGRPCENLTYREYCHLHR